MTSQLDHLTARRVEQRRIQLYDRILLNRYLAESARRYSNRWVDEFSIHYLAKLSLRLLDQHADVIVEPLSFRRQGGVDHAVRDLLHTHVSCLVLLLLEEIKKFNESFVLHRINVLLETLSKLLVDSFHHTKILDLAVPLTPGCPTGEVTLDLCFERLSYLCSVVRRRRGDVKYNTGVSRFGVFRDPIVDLTHDRAGDDIRPIISVSPTITLGDRVYRILGVFQGLQHILEMRRILTVLAGGRVIAESKSREAGEPQIILGLAEVATLLGFSHEMRIVKVPDERYLITITHSADISYLKALI